MKYWIKYLSTYKLIIIDIILKNIVKSSSKTPNIKKWEIVETLVNNTKKLEVAADTSGNNPISSSKGVTTKPPPTPKNPLKIPLIKAIEI